MKAFLCAVGCENFSWFKRVEANNHHAALRRVSHEDLGNCPCNYGKGQPLHPAKVVHVFTGEGGNCKWSADTVSPMQSIGQPA